MRKPLLAWLGIVVWVAIYDIWAMRRRTHTLSSAFRFASHHRHGRLLVWPGWAFLTWHLFSGRSQQAT